MRSPVRNGTVPSFAIGTPSNVKSTSRGLMIFPAADVGATRRTYTPPSREEGRAPDARASASLASCTLRYLRMSGFSSFCHSRPSVGKPV